MSRLTAVTLIALTCLLPIVANAQGFGDETKETQKHRKVALFPVRHADAQSLARTLAEAFAGRDDVKITPAPNGVLLVSGTDEKIQDVLALLKELDAPPKLVRLRLTLAEVKGETGDLRERIEMLRAAADPQKELKQWAAQKLTSRITHSEMTLLEDQQSQIQIGEQTPVVSGGTSRGGFRRGDARGGMVSVVRQEQVGTMITAIARVAGTDQITAEISIEKSQIREGGVEIGKTDDGAALKIPQKDTFVMQATQRIAHGKEAVVGVMQSHSADGPSFVVLLRAEIVASGGK